MVPPLIGNSVVLATGASARPSPWPARSGARPADVGRRPGTTFGLARDRPVLVVGGGFIGAEVAAAARALGREVTVIDPLPAPSAALWAQSWERCSTNSINATV